MNKASMALRVNQNLIMDEPNFQGFRRLLLDHPGLADELALFHTATHSPLKLEIVRERTAILKERVVELREMGYRVGINVLTTIGQHEENLPNSFTENVTHTTDLSGGISLGAICPNDERARAYIRELYRIVAGAGPDFIWLDDDIRFWHWPNGMGCFCDRCLALFEEETGVKYTRDSLKCAFDEGTEESRLRNRKAWLSHNRNTMTRLLSLVEQTVHEINPMIVLGQMTGDRFEEGYDFDTWADLLSGPGGLPVLWRPGGGFYRERDPRDMAAKSTYIARQVALLPEKVRSIQAEIERIPANAFGKSVHMMSTEAAVYIAAGATGVAVNSYLDEDDDVSAAYPLFGKLLQNRPFYDLLARTLGRSRAVGIFDPWTKDSVVTRSLRSGEWFGAGEAGNFVVPSARCFFQTGLPAAYRREDSCMTILSDDGILAFDSKEILEILSGGVYLDANALERLNRMGYGELTGFRIGEIRTVDTVEKYTAHPLNRGIEGKVRDARQSFLDSMVPAALLEPTRSGAQSISGAVDYTPKDIAACCTGIFENELGGRICAAGYYPWTMLHYHAKLRQLKSVARWLSRDTLPAYVDSPHRIGLWVRKPDGMAAAMLLLNAHFDPAERIALKILTGEDFITVTDRTCARSRIQAAGVDGAYREFMLPPIEPWDVRFVTV